MSPDKKYPEVNLWSVLWGIAMAVLFSAAAAYLGLKVGQVFEAAIPIAIIAVGVSGAAKRKNALGENVIIQSIGASSGVIVAGAIFTLPALYILQESYPQEITVTFAQVFISSLLGGVLGILSSITFAVMFRKRFMHGKYPFPEATATTQVLVSGEKGGSQAKPLLMAGIIGGLYDFIVATFGWWNENFTTRVCGFGEMLAEKAKLVFRRLPVRRTGSGLYRRTEIRLYHLCRLACRMVDYHPRHVPYLGRQRAEPMESGDYRHRRCHVSRRNLQVLCQEHRYRRHCNGGYHRHHQVMGHHQGAAVEGWATPEMGGKADAETNVKRTQRDLSMKIIAIGSIVTLILVTLFFYFDVMQGNLMHTVVAILLVAGISFLFTTVAANAICHCGNQSGIGHDADDAYPCIGSNGGGRPERSRRNGGSAGYGRCGLYGTVHGGRFHHRP